MMKKPKAKKALIPVGLKLTEQEANDLRRATKVDALAPAAKIAVREKIASAKAGA